MTSLRKSANDQASYKLILVNVNIMLLPPRIQKHIKPQPCPAKGLIGDCWVWTGFCYQGYGRLRYGNFKTRKAHRIIYELLKGPIPNGLEPDHLCKVRSCVNPDHIEPVTRIENLNRSATLGVVNRAKTHCPRGHEYTPQNTYSRFGRRYCKTCQGYKVLA